ncbi:IS630 family transposase [Streptomyces sp. NPDC056653]|uniref:IS630 family transposase n=1 Tax=Streptomyces sp. NPDC056653 TaxID=3345894 RepID=UPI00367A6B50
MDPQVDRQVPCCPRDLRLPDRADPVRPGPQTPPRPRLAHPPRRPGLPRQGRRGVRPLPALPTRVVLSVDEKTAMQARSRRHPTRPARPGHAERREFEYRRHGTASIVVALDVHNGQVLVEDIARNDSVTFIRFLRLLDGSIDPALAIHLVLDNGSSHVSKATRAWLAAHPRFTVHHTPKHASWLNQVEIFFSTLARRLLRRGEFTSRQDLIDQIREFTLAYDKEACPFRWTYDGTPLKAT